MQEPCPACQEKVNYVDYKQTDVLRKFVSGQFKIFGASRTGFCKKHQRAVTHAIKLARFMALMPFTRAQTRKK